MQEQQNQQNRERDHQEAEERKSPGGAVIYQAILQEGAEELQRSSVALFWSGLAAGLSMGFSMIARGLLHAYLPDQEWRTLVASAGYSLGFLIVILGRQQLFTENTLTAILPLLARHDARTALNVLRLWGVVLLANLLGALGMAFLTTRPEAFDPEVRHAFTELGLKAMEPDWGSLLLRGIFAGWLIALMVWLLPFADVGRVWVIVILTYFVALGHFSHVIAGSVESFALAWEGSKTWGTVIANYVLPTLLGNIVGGVLLVATLNHTQVTAGKDGHPARAGAGSADS